MEDNRQLHPTEREGDCRCRGCCLHLAVPAAFGPCRCHRRCHRRQRVVLQQAGKEGGARSWLGTTGPAADGDNSIQFWAPGPCAAAECGLQVQVVALEWRESTGLTWFVPQARWRGCLGPSRLRLPLTMSEGSLLRSVPSSDAAAARVTTASHSHAAGLSAPLMALLTWRSGPQSCCKLLQRHAGTVRLYCEGAGSVGSADLG